MLRSKIKITAVDKLHFGSDNPARSNVKQNRRDSFPIEPRTISSILKKEDRDSLIVYILNSLYSSSSSDLKKHDYFYSSIIYASREQTIPEFIETVMRRQSSTFIYENFVDSLHLINNDEFLYFIRKKPQYYILKLRTHSKSGAKIDPSTFEKIEKYSIESKLDVEIPIGSANSFKHTLRVLLAEDFLTLIGKNELSDKGLVFFQNGGVKTKGGGSDFVMEQTNREFQNMCPMVGLLGAMDDLVNMTSVLTIGDLVPRCKELETGHQSFYELMVDVFATTGDARNDDRVYDNKRAEKQAMLPYYQESFKRGTEFDVSFSLRPIVNDMDMMHAVLHRGLILLKEYAMLGAKNSVAHGNVELHFDESIFNKKQDHYLDYIEANKAKMLEFWNNIF